MSYWLDSLAAKTTGTLDMLQPSVIPAHIPTPWPNASEAGAGVVGCQEWHQGGSPYV